MRVSPVGHDFDLVPRPACDLAVVIFVQIGNDVHLAVRQRGRGHHVAVHLQRHAAGRVAFVDAIDDLMRVVGQRQVVRVGWDAHIVGVARYGYSMRVGLNIQRNRRDCIGDDNIVVWLLLMDMRLVCVCLA